MSLLVVSRDVCPKQKIETHVRWTKGKYRLWSRLLSRTLRKSLGLTAYGLIHVMHKSFSSLECVSVQTTDLFRLKHFKSCAHKTGQNAHNNHDWFILFEESVRYPWQMSIRRKETLLILSAENESSDESTPIIIRCNEFLKRLPQLSFLRLQWWEETVRRCNEDARDVKRERKRILFDHD